MIPVLPSCRPAVLLLALVLLTGACNDGGTRPEQVLVATDTADQTMYGMETLIEDAGRRKNRVLADTADLYESSQIIEFRTLTVEFFDPKGNATATLTARQGTYWPQQRRMEAREDVRVVFTDGRRLSAEVLRFDQEANEVTTDRPFVFERPDGVLRGNGFRSDPEFTSIRVEQPTGEQRDGGGVLLPGQEP